MKTTLLRLLSLKGQVFAPGCWLLILFLCHATVASAAVDGTFTVTETWSVTLSYRDFANGVTRTDRSTGTLTGKLRIADGQYEVIDRTGLPWESPGRDLKGRTLTYNGFSYDIEGDYVFAPAYGSRAYGLVFLGCFAVKVPLLDGEVPIFYDYETYSASGSSLDAMHGGGNMIGSSLKVYVSSTISLREVVGPPQISQQPRSQSLFEGQSATFSVAAGGREPLGYFWRKGGAPLPGANGPSLTLTNLQLSDAGAYSVVVTNAGGNVASAAAQLTVKLPPPPWFEGWESAVTGRYAPSSNAEVTVAGDRGRWVIADTVSFFPECYPIGNHADVVIGNGRKSLRLFSVPNNGSCAENISVDIDGRTSPSIPIPLLPASEVSFFAQGAMVNPLWNGFFQCINKPCGDTTHLRITDDRNNQVLYILQRAPNYVEHALTNGPSNFGYREIFLDPAGGSFARNLYADLASIAGSAGVGKAVVGVEFALASAGWAELDDLRIGSTSGTSDNTKPTVTILTPANRARLLSPTVALTGTAQDGVAVERVEVRVGSGPFQNAIGAAKWTANLELSPGTNVIRARARDTSGNYSTEAIWSLVQVPASPLALTVGPGGKVTGATNGQALEVGRAYTLTAVPNAGFLFTQWSGDFTSTSPVLAFVMQSNLSVRAEFRDVARPVVTVTTPLNKARTSSAAIAVRGKATDNGVVDRVLFQLNETPYAPAEGTANWQASVTLKPGTNLFRVRSVDSAGNESATVTNRYVLVVTSLLTLVSSGGKVTGATNGQALEVGRAYSLTAVPNAGFLFSNWTGGVLSSTNPLRFVMTSNLVLEANFVANPFLLVAGQFNGLFRNPSAVEHGSSGAFKAEVQRSGLFTASLQTGARKLAFTGRFGLDGKATNTVARRGTNALTVELWLKLDGSEEMIGRVTDGSWSSELLADRAVFNARANPATDFAGQYTMLIPGGTNGSVMEPAGDGFASVIISRAGLATIRSTLADGTSAVLAVPVSKGGDVPLYLPLYGGAGSASGWLRVLPSSEVDLNGEVAWFKPARRVPTIYRNGFTLSSPVVGSVYTPFGTNRFFDADTASVAFADGGLMSAFTNVVTLGPSGRVTFSPPSKLTLKAVSATGLFTGSVVPPEGTKPVPFKGALLQRQGYGGGFFLNEGQSGRVWLGP